MKRIIITSVIFCMFTTSVPFAANISLPRTGQTTSYGAGDDGALQKGVAWPNPRFTDNGSGTVTDNLTGLIWLKNANCTETIGGVAKANVYLAWADAIAWCNALANGTCGLTDSSTSGQWRLPNVTELESLVDTERYNPAFPTVQPFYGVLSAVFWSSTSDANNPNYAFYVNMYNGSSVSGYISRFDKSNLYYVWPVRSGQ